MYYHAHIRKKDFVLYTIAILLIPVLAYGYLMAVKHLPYLFPSCALKTYFHLYCPGCGGTRAVYQLLCLHPVKSLLYNPLVLFMALTLFYYWCKALVQLIKQHGDAKFDIHLGFLWAFLIFMILFFIVRNFLLLRYGIDYLGELV